MAKLPITTLATVSTSRGTVYLFWPGQTELTALRSFPAEGSTRNALQQYASLQSRKYFPDPFVPLPDEVRDGLSDDDLAAIGEAVRQRSTKTGVMSRPAVPEREPDEDGDGFLRRALAAHLEETRAGLAKIKASSAESISAALRGVELRNAQLGKTLDHYRELEKPLFTEPSRHMAREQEEFRRRREREETATKAAIESAAMLRALGSVATDVMARLAKQDATGEEQFRHQIWVAILTAGVSVVVAAIGTGYAIASYRQDAAKNAADAVEARVAAEAAATAAGAAAARDRAIQLLLQQNAALLEQLRSAQVAPQPVRPASR